MSTVFWHKGVMYSDSQVTNVKLVSEDGRVPPEAITKGKKIFREGDKIYGVTGCLGTYSSFVNRGYTGSWRWSKESNDMTLIIEWDGENLIGWKLREKKIFFIYINWFEKTRYELKKSENLRLSMGSGSDYADEAVELGLTIPEAIQYASDRDPYTDDEVVSMTL